MTTQLVGNGPLSKESSRVEIEHAAMIMTREIIFVSPQESTSTSGKVPIYAPPGELVCTGKSVWRSNKAFLFLPVKTSDQPYQAKPKPPQKKTEKFTDETYPPGHEITRRVSHYLFYGLHFLSFFRHHLEKRPKITWFSFQTHTLVRINPVGYM